MRCAASRHTVEPRIPECLQGRKEGRIGNLSSPTPPPSSSPASWPWRAHVAHAQKRHAIFHATYLDRIGLVALRCADVRRNPGRQPSLSFEFETLPRSPARWQTGSIPGGYEHGAEERGLTCHMSEEGERERTSSKIRLDSNKGPSFPDSGNRKKLAKYGQPKLPDGKI